MGFRAGCHGAGSGRQLSVADQAAAYHTPTVIVPVKPTSCMPQCSASLLVSCPDPIPESRLRHIMLLVFTFVLCFNAYVKTTVFGVAIWRKLCKHYAYCVRKMLQYV